MAHSMPAVGTGPRQVEIFEEEGVDLAKVQIAHCGDTDDVDYIEGLIDKGVYVGLDRYGLEMYLPIDKRNATAAELLRRGHAERLMISQDFCATIDWFPPEAAEVFESQGAIRNWSMTLVFDEVVPALRELGAMDDAVVRHDLRGEPQALADRVSRRAPATGDRRTRALGPDRARARRADRLAVRAGDRRSGARPRAGHPLDGEDAPVAPRPDRARRADRARRRRPCRDMPARVKWPLGVGAWTNAMSFGVLVAAPDAKDHPVYRAGVVGSFVATSTGFVGMAAEGFRRRQARTLAPDVWASEGLGRVEPRGAALRSREGKGDREGRGWRAMRAGPIAGSRDAAAGAVRRVADRAARAPRDLPRRRQRAADRADPRDAQLLQPLALRSR